MLRSLRCSNSLRDLDGLVQDLVDVCRSPAAINEPEVGRATLAVSAATAALERAAHQRTVAAELQARIQDALRGAREALFRAREATEEARITSARAAGITARVRARREPTGGLETPSPAQAWTTSRAVPVTCPVCAGIIVIRYRYSFMEGLRARTVSCPRRSCPGAVPFHFPLNSVDVSVEPSPLDSRRGRH